MSAYPTTAEMERIAEETYGVIERDSGQKLNPRMRAVLKHWMVRNMREVRDATVMHQLRAMETITETLKSARHL